MKAIKDCNWKIEILIFPGPTRKRNVIFWWLAKTNDFR